MQRKDGLRLDTCVQQAKAFGFMSYAKPASYSPQITSATAQFCYTHSNVVDGIIITGDLATSGHPNDIAEARDFVCADASDGFLSARRKPTLASSSLPVWVIPGNHDKYADDFATPKCRNFELTFRAYMPNFARGVGHKVRRKGDSLLGIVYADFCLRVRSDAQDRVVAPYGQGKVYTDTLQELENRTRNLRTKYSGIVIVWSIHFAPYDCGYTLALLDWNLISQSAIKNGIILTLCGHTHIASKFQSAGNTVYCAGSSGAIDRENASEVHIVSIDVGKTLNVRRKNFKWDRSAGEFTRRNDD